MLHVTKQTLLGSVAIIDRKGEEDDPVSIVTKSLEDLQKKVSDELAKVPNGAEIKALTDRIAEMEKKANRPGAGGGNGDEQQVIERKALASYMRTGSDVEVKAAATDNNVDGGYFVLPTVDMTIRTLMTDLSPMRGLAEVVSISTDKYERFYSLGKRGAQWVTERDDRPQDTARPELIKHSYGVAELYAAPAATRTLLDDSAVDIASWLTNNATHDFAETEGEAFLDGDGTDNSPWPSELSDCIGEGFQPRLGQVPVYPGRPCQRPDRQAAFRCAHQARFDVAPSLQGQCRIPDERQYPAAGFRHVAFKVFDPRFKQYDQALFIIGHYA